MLLYHLDSRQENTCIVTRKTVSKNEDQLEKYVSLISKTIDHSGMPKMRFIKQETDIKKEYFIF